MIQDCSVQAVSLMKPEVTIITHFPSPYQVELFDAVAAQNEINLSVIYLYATSPERRWQSPRLDHAGVFVDGPEQDVPRASALAGTADLTVFNYYQHPLARSWLARRAQAHQPWAFWGERLGFRASALVGWLYRRWALRELARSPAPIWGIGRWAVESYQVEYGPARRFHNFPYFSDLTRFGVAASGRVPAGDQIRFLCSGSLIERKGVDLLATAFRRLAAVEPRATLCFLGDGALLPSLRRELTDLAGRVEFLGFKDWSELPAIYGRADVLCAPSRHDGWGLIVPEALAAGLPVIGTTRTGAAREFLRTGHKGWLIPAGNGEALFQAMHDAVRRGPETIALMSRRAQEAVANHTLENGAARLVAASRSALRHWNN